VKPRSTERAAGCIDALARQADSWTREGRYREAEPLYREGLARAERAYGPSARRTAAALEGLAMVCKHLGKLAEAGLLYQRALRIVRDHPGLRATVVATLYRRLGELEHAAGNPARGEPFARKALQLRKQAKRVDLEEVAADLAALASLLEGQKQYDEAERLYRRALALLERRHGPEHLAIAATLNNLAAIRQARGNAVEAEALYRQALVIKEKLLPADHPDLAVGLNNLAVLYKSRREYARARSAYEQALAVFERALGPEHPSVGVCLENYAQLLRRLGRRSEATELEARAERIRARLDRLDDQALAVTATINPESACFRLAVRPSPVHRWGVFVEEPIPARRKVIEYTGARISRRAARHCSDRSLDYLFFIDRHWAIDGAVGGSGAEYINHACDPNLRAQLVRGHILYVSKRAIDPGEELTVDYRFAPDAKQVRCRCGSPNCRGTINLVGKPARSLRP
jgi:tetratricopeptide (TPR) repeat protein